VAGTTTEHVVMSATTAVGRVDDEIQRSVDSPTVKGLGGANIAAIAYLSDGTTWEIAAAGADSLAIPERPST
jgi:hypothetical protein